MKVQGKGALVTGASSGIGAAIAEELAREGASVTVNYCRNQAGAAAVGTRIEATGQVALLVQADVRHRDEVARLFRR